MTLHWFRVSMTTGWPVQLGGSPRLVRHAFGQVLPISTAHINFLFFRRHFDPSHSMHKEVTTSNTPFDHFVPRSDHGTHVENHCFSLEKLGFLQSAYPNGPHLYRVLRCVLHLLMTSASFSSTFGPVLVRILVVRLIRQFLIKWPARLGTHTCMPA